MAPGPIEMCFINSSAPSRVEVEHANMGNQRRLQIALDSLIKPHKTMTKGREWSIRRRCRWRWRRTTVVQSSLSPRFPIPIQILLVSSSLRLLFLTCILWVIGPASTSPSEAVETTSIGRLSGPRSLTLSLTLTPGPESQLEPATTTLGLPSRQSPPLGWPQVNMAGDQRPKPGCPWRARKGN